MAAAEDRGCLWLRFPGESWQRLERVRLARVTEDWLVRYRKENAIPAESELIALPIGATPPDRRPENFLEGAEDPA